MPVLLEVQNLSRQFRGRELFWARSVNALNSVSFQINQGETFGLIGESGSGKSTLARAIMMLERPSSGDVYFKGVHLNKAPEHVLRRLRSRMQIVLQDSNAALNPRLSILASMEEGLANQRVAKAERVDRVRSLLTMVGIPPDLMNRYPHEFSGGQRQRIVIARALSLKPEFLVLDEPVSNLDLSIKAGILNLLQDLKQEFKLTYLFISHDLDVLGYMSDRIGVMIKGKMVEIGDVDRILNKPEHPYTRALVDNPLTFTRMVKEGQS